MSRYTPLLALAVASGCVLSPPPDPAADEGDIGRAQLEAIRCDETYPGPTYSGACRSGSPDLACGDSCADFASLQGCLRAECEAACGAGDAGMDGGSSAYCVVRYDGDCVSCAGGSGAYPIGHYECVTSGGDDPVPSCDPVADGGGGGSDGGGTDGGGTDGGGSDGGGTDGGGTDGGVSDGGGSDGGGSDGGGSDGGGSDGGGSDGGGSDGGGSDGGGPDGGVSDGGVSDGGVSDAGPDGGSDGGPGDPCEGVVCDDADPCTNDLCDGGVCTHPPRAAECCRSDDDCVSEAMNMCIQTRCDVDTGYCVHEPTGDCECLPIDLPQLDVSPPALELSDFSVPCPGFVGGGRLGFSEVEAELSASVNPMQCSNGCEGSASVEASLGAEIDFCQRFGLAGSFEASYERSDRGCLTCGTEEGGCEEQCEGECSTDSTSGTLEVSVEKFFGWSAGGGIGGNSISAFFTCGATVGASGSGSLTNEWVENDGYSCGDCQQCQSTDASLEASVSAGLKCQFRLNAFGQQINLGCESCAGVEVTGSVGGRLQTGECGAEGCVRGSVSGRVYAQTPCASLGWGWFSVSARCTATVAGCAEATTCGACTCGDGEPSASGVCLDGNITPEIECATGC